MKWLEVTTVETERGAEETGRALIRLPKDPTVILFEFKNGNTGLTIDSYSMTVTESPDQLMRQLALLEEPDGPVYHGSERVR